MSSAATSKQRRRALKRVQKGKSPGAQAMSLNLRPVMYTTHYLNSGAATTGATTAGYSWLTIDSTLFNSSSPWTQLAALYNFVRPVGAKVTVAYCRATGTSDNPRVGFAQTPDGTPVGNAGMNLSTFESALCKSYTCGPGEEFSAWFPAKVQMAVYAPTTNGYQAINPGRLNLNSLPRVYFGDILFFTPGVVLTSTGNYVSIKIEFIFEFSVLEPTNIQ